MSKMTNAEFNELFCVRTMEFAQRIIRFVETLPFNTTTKVLEISCASLRLQLVQSIEHFVEPVQKMRDFPKFVLLLKKPMKVVIG